MSKFAKPAAAAAIINRAVTDDGSESAPTDKRFTMDITAQMSADIDASRKTHKLTRVAWIRQAISEKLAREARRASNS